MEEAIGADAGRKILELAKALERGDFRRRFTGDLPGISGEIAAALNVHCQILQTFARESIWVINEIGVIGKLGPQADVPNPRGTWHNMIQSLNFLICCLTSQVRDISQTIDAMGSGDHARRVTDNSMCGEYEELRQRVNRLAEQLEQNAALMKC